MHLNATQPVAAASHLHQSALFSRRVIVSAAHLLIVRNVTFKNERQKLGRLELVPQATNLFNKKQSLLVYVNLLFSLFVFGEFFHYCKSRMCEEFK